MKNWLNLVGSGALQRRLLQLLLLPLLLVALLNTWFDYRLADSAAIQQDRQLLTLVPALADAVRSDQADGTLTLSLSPELAEFLSSRAGAADYAILNADGRVLAGAEWLRDYPPDTHEPEFSSQELRGAVYRIVTQRVSTRAGELTVRLADGVSLRWQRLRRLWLNVLLPNLFLTLLAFAAVQWAVRQALQPLLKLKDEVDGRSPRDLSPLDEASSLEEVRPLVRALNHLFELVNAQAAAQARFVADAAHQLRTPLAGLQALVEALTQNRPSGVADEPIMRLRDATRRTSQLVQQLLTLSRVEAPGGLVRPGQRADLRQLCEQVLEEHLDRASLRRIDLGLDARSVWCEGEAWLLHELLSNLTDNALKYTPEGGRVTLRCGLCEPDGTDAFLEVEDDGPGIDPELWPRLLQRFYRGNTANAAGAVGMAGMAGVAGMAGAAAVEGNGLGLAIADEIARAHHSQLQIGRGRGRDRDRDRDDGGQGGQGRRGLCVSLRLRAVRELTDETPISP